MPNEMLYNNEIYVGSLDEYIKAVVDMSKSFSDSPDSHSLLWYRGHENSNYLLTPSIFRGTSNAVNTIQNKKNYTSFHLRQDMRLQQFHAKNYHFLKNDGLNTMEWMAVAQHYGVKTRLLDWSTSAMHALLFALERLFKLGDVSKSEFSPCVWVLQPQELNKRIKDIIVDKREDIRNAIIKADQSIIQVSTIDKLGELLMDLQKDEYKNIYLESDRIEDKHMNYIYNLAYFEELLGLVSKNPQVAYSGNYVNPLYCVLAKIYVDGLVLKGTDLPPLATIYPYHSDRIKAQQGVFTIFPFPNDRDNAESNVENDVCMEYSKYTKGILNKIIIKSPEKIANELRTIGAHRSWLYPESPIVADEIENGL